MATPSDKNKVIENLITNTFGVNRRSNIRKNVCVMCGQSASWFRDTLSRKEFAISGMCQGCQDDFFGDDEEEDSY